MRWNMDPSLATNEVASLRQASTSQPSTVSPEAGNAAASMAVPLAAESSLSPSVILLPPDTFRADMNTVVWGLARMESKWTESLDPMLPDASGQQNWGGGIGEAERLIDSIEFSQSGSNE